MDITVQVMPILQSFGVVVNKCSFCCVVFVFWYCILNINWMVRRVLKNFSMVGIEEFFNCGYKY